MSGSSQILPSMLPLHFPDCSYTCMTFQRKHDHIAVVGRCCTCTRPDVTSAKILPRQPASL